MESLLQKRTIGHKVKAGEEHWYLLPMVIGMYEAQDGDPKPDFLADADSYMKTAAYGSSLLAVDPPQMRTIPIHQSIHVEHRAATYDQIEATLKEATGPFVVLKCICRQKKALQGQPCKQASQSETCLAFGDMGAMVLHRNHGRDITRDEALAILKRNQQDGLVLQPANAQRPEFVCSCCGCCCGMLSVHKKLPHPVDFWSSNFLAEVETEKCSRCGKCVKRCQVDAVTLPRKRKGPARIKSTRCIGCGLCVTTCPSNAMHLKNRVTQAVPPETYEDLYDEIAAKKRGPWARRRMLARVLLRMRQ